MSETCKSTAILADNLRTIVQDAHAEHSRDSVIAVNQTWHLSVKSGCIRSCKRNYLHYGVVFLK